MDVFELLCRGVRYFSLQATHPVGFTDMVRFEVEQQICSERGPHPHCFATAIRLLLHVLDQVRIRY